jgi:hypothetical protein
MHAMMYDSQLLRIIARMKGVSSFIHEKIHGHLVGLIRSNKHGKKAQ